MISHVINNPHAIGVLLHVMSVAESPHKDRPHSWNPNWLILVIVALAILPYIPSLDGDFVFDDSATILNNPIVTGKSYLKQVCQGVQVFKGFPRKRSVVMITGPACIKGFTQDKWGGATGTKIRLWINS